MNRLKRNAINTSIRYGRELYVLWGTALILCIPMAFYSIKIFLVEVFISILAILVTWILRDNSRKNMLRVMEDISKRLNPVERKALQSFPMSVLVTNKKNVCVWCNSRFEKGVYDGESPMGKSLDNIMDGIVFDGETTSSFEGNGEYAGKKFTVYGSYISADDGDFYIYYFLDDTVLKDTYEEFRRTRPNVAIFVVDNYEELTDKERATEKTKVQLMVEEVLDNFISGTTGVLVRIRADRYMVFIENQFLDKMISSKFDVLDELRKLANDAGIPITLSIGVGSGAQTMQEAESFAKGALDMAQGRGGDQAVIKDSSGYSFFGGVSQAIEKRTKVKTRIVAAAMHELIDASSKVIIMGHKNADLDSMGAAIGLAGSIRRMAKSVRVVFNQKTNLASNVVEKLSQSSGYERVFISPDEAINEIDSDTLLIVVDTHSKNMVESKELLSGAKNVAVIDHHRKMVDYISDAVMFYHEPYVSSTSEMVTELIQYFGEQCDINRAEAEILMAGIMLDTKNFVVKTGVRTFEAAAYLRRRGADTVEVKKMFSGSMEAYKLRSLLVSNAVIHHNCAISVVSKNHDMISIIAPQAADELLSISGVDASFVLYKKGDSINISARSMGIINVQVILEKLGGGGHHTMAGVQIKGGDINDILEKLKTLIEEYSN